MASILQSLAASDGFPRISIYVPTHPAFPQSEQDPIRFKNALREVENQLERAGLRTTVISELIGDAMARVDDSEFWKFQDEGLAVFIEDGATRWLKLPGSVDELTVIADRYHIRPLIHLLRDHGTFYVLTVSLGEAHLLKGSAGGLTEVKVENLPSSIDKVRGKTDFDADLGFHNRDRGSQVGGGAAPKYSALGESPEDYEDVLLTHYMADIAKAVDAHLAATTAPLVLAALPRVAGHLARHVNYPHVQSDTVSVDPQSLSSEDLHDRAWQIAQKVLLAERDGLRSRITAATEGDGTAFSRNIEDIIRATDDGRVATVFLSPDTMVWGHYDPTHRVIRIDREPGPENEDLLNLAALKTLAQGGDVRKLPDDVSGPVAALFRY